MGATRAEVPVCFHSYMKTTRTTRARLLTGTAHGVPRLPTMTYTGCGETASVSIDQYT